MEWQVGCATTHDVIHPRRQQGPRVYSVIGPLSCPEAVVSHRAVSHDYR